MSSRLLMNHSRSPRTSGADWPSMPVPQRTWSITPYRAADKAAVMALLPIVGQRYPDGMQWLDGRLDDARDGRARCTVVREAGGRAVGAAIETPKSGRRMKLSTLWIDPLFRGYGAGTALVDTLVERWLRCDLEEAWVTTDLARCDDLLPAVSRVGFSPLAVAADRYGDGRCEIVYGWTPS